MLDKKDILILAELRKDSRQSLADISRKTGIPVSTIFDKLIKLNKDVLKKNVSLFDFDKMGYGVRVNFIIKCKKERGIKDFLLSNTNINSAYRINNGGDFLIECIFKNLYELEIFKEELANFGIEDLKEHHIVEEIKKEEFLTKKEHLSEYSKNIFP